MPSTQHSHILLKCLALKSSSQHSHLIMDIPKFISLESIQYKYFSSPKYNNVKKLLELSQVLINPVLQPLNVIKEKCSKEQINLQYLTLINFSKRCPQLSMGAINVRNTLKLSVPKMPFLRFRPCYFIFGPLSPQFLIKHFLIKMSVIAPAQLAKQLSLPVLTFAKLQQNIRLKEAQKIKKNLLYE